MIEIANLTQKYKSAIVLDNVNISVKQGEILGIIGDKDSGKTTLMEIIAGVLSPSVGNIKIGEFDMVTDPLQAKRLIGYVPEKMDLYGEMTVLEYLSFVAEAKKIPYQSIQQAIKNALSATGLLVVRNAVISKLNKVARVRLALAQAVLQNPCVLLLDCPTLGLSDSECVEIYKLIKTLSQSRTTIITSRDIEVSDICDRTLTLSFGHIDYNYHTEETEEQA